MKNDIAYYSVGALLYCPANKADIAQSIISGRLGDKFSLALCLEDAISDHFVEKAEQTLLHSMGQIYLSYQAKPFDLPKIFIRVRTPEQILRLTKALGSSVGILTGFILPKFSETNAVSYVQAVIQANESAGKKLYIMPIYESSTIIDLRSRADTLYTLKDSLSAIEELVLNIRVGGNDLCHTFGFRRRSDESIHRIRPVADIFSDIMTVYSMDYVVSGPVWEYYSGDHWKEGMELEISDDKLCGFVGKTVIHPNQIPVVNEAYKVLKSDFRDAQQILDWDPDSDSYVAGNHAGERMNEYKTHSTWARRTLFLAEAFGLRD